MASSKFLRVREPGKHAIYDPDRGLHVVPDPQRQYTADDAIVQAAPWAFGTEEDIEREQRERDSVTSVPIGDVEQATSAPGEKRSTIRRRSRVADDVVDGAKKSEEVAPTPALKKLAEEGQTDGNLTGEQENEGLKPGDKVQHPITVSGTNAAE